jgi:chloramphenicol 3-O-phosphotransferase
LKNEPFTIGECAGDCSLSCSSRAGQASAAPAVSSLLRVSKMRSDVDSIIFCMTSNNVVAARVAVPAAENARGQAQSAVAVAADRGQSRVDSGGKPTM